MNSWKRIVMGSVVGGLGMLAIGCVASPDASDLDSDTAPAEEESVGEASAAFSTVMSRPSPVHASSAASVSVFFTNSAGQVVRRTQAANGTWSETQMSAPTGLTVQGAPSCVSAAAGAIDCFVRHSDNKLRRISFIPGEGWESEWSELGSGAGSSSLSSPAAIVRATGVVDVFYKDSASTYLSRATWDGTSWTGPSNFWISTPTDPSCAYSPTWSRWTCGIAASPNIGFYAQNGSSFFNWHFSQASLTAESVATRPGGAMFQSWVDVLSLVPGVGVYERLFDPSTSSFYSFSGIGQNYLIPGTAALVEAPQCTPMKDAANQQLDCFSKNSSNQLMRATWTQNSVLGTWSAWTALP